MARLILTSGSKNHHDLLSPLRIPFEVVTPDFKPNNLFLFRQEGASVYARNIAQALAEEVAKTPMEPDVWILSTAHVVWSYTRDEKDRILYPAPGTQENAIQQLLMLRGQTCFSTASVFLWNLDPSKRSKGLCTSRLTMRSFSEEEAHSYVENFQPLDRPGSFRVEDRGISLVFEFTGDWTGCQGFPMPKIAHMLREARLL